MAKSMKMNNRKAATLKKSGTACKRALTSFLILGIALILLRGLRALKTLKDFKWIADAPISSNILSPVLKRLFNKLTQL